MEIQTINFLSELQALCVKYNAQINTGSATSSKFIKVGDEQIDFIHVNRAELYVNDGYMQFHPTVSHNHVLKEI